MTVYSQKKRWKLLLLLGAIVIGFFTIWYTNQLVEELKESEYKKVELWAEAIHVLSVSETNTDNSYLNLINLVISNNTTIPVVLTDTLYNVLSHNNITVPTSNVDEFWQNLVGEMRASENKIEIDLGDNDKQFLFFGESLLIQKLSWFPLVQLVVVAFFLLLAYIAFSVSRKAEQNQVWVGMAKETAHQLGTPTSSLLAWIDILKLKTVDLPYIEEMSKDVGRLKTIADRFSKIGAKPVLVPTDLNALTASTIEYLKVRLSSKVVFTIVNKLNENTLVNINSVLFEWVIENICKNAIDAMEGKGSITLNLYNSKSNVIIDITDTGKGMPKSSYKAIFMPGFTTKSRGWGLGLTLVRRIIENYHFGKVFVAESAIGKGTTFRIVLKKL